MNNITEAFEGKTLVITGGTIIASTIIPQKAFFLHGFRIDFFRDFCRNRRKQAKKTRRGVKAPPSVIFGPFGPLRGRLPSPSVYILVRRGAGSACEGGGVPM